MTLTTPDNTRKIVTTLLVLVLLSLACAQVVTTVTPTAPPSPSPTLPPTTSSPVPASTATAESVTTVTIRAVVWVRSEPDGTRIGSLETGQSVELIGCDGQWCEVEYMFEDAVVRGFVFRGCTSDNPDNLDCEAAK
jgi:hypothetical protein